MTYLGLADEACLVLGVGRGGEVGGHHADEVVVADVGLARVPAREEVRAVGVNEGGAAGWGGCGGARGDGSVC